MTAFATQWLWWIFGTFGLVGLVAFWFLAPTAGQLTLQIVVRLFKLLLSYRIGCALLAAIAAGLIVDHKRHAYDDEQFAKRTAAFEAAQDHRDATVAQNTRDRVWIDIGNQTALNVETAKEVKEFRDVLPPTPKTGNVFRIGDDDARRLCIIAYGKVGCGPSGGKRVPEARRPGRHSDNSGLRFPDAVRRIVGDN